MPGPNREQGNLLRVLGISGSLRRGSYNTALLRVAQEICPPVMEITIWHLKEIPMYDADLEEQGDPQSVASLKLAVRQADGVFFATPEYNFGVPGVLKNAIDWISRDAGALNGKPVTMIGAGGVAGTARAQLQLQYVLSETGAILMVKPGLQVIRPWYKFSPEGKLLDEETCSALRNHLCAFQAWIERLSQWTFRSPSDE